MIKFVKCTITKPLPKHVVKEIKKCAEVKIKIKCPPKYYDCCKPVKCYDGGSPA